MMRLGTIIFHLKIKKYQKYLNFCIFSLNIFNFYESLKVVSINMIKNVAMPTKSVNLGLLKIKMFESYDFIFFFMASKQKSIK